MNNNIKTIQKFYAALEERVDKDGKPYTGIYVYLTPSYSKYVKDVTKAEKELIEMFNNSSNTSNVNSVENLTNDNVF